MKHMKLFVKRQTGSPAGAKAGTKTGTKAKSIGRAVVVLLLALCLLTPVSASSAEQAPEPEYNSFSELNGKRIAMLTGAPFEELIRSKVPEAEDFMYFTSLPDMITALKSGKIDAFLNNNAVGQLTVNKDREMVIFPESLGDTVFGFAFKKGSAERETWQRAFDRIPEEEVQEIWEEWTGADESVKAIPAQDWPGEGGTVHVAACDTLPPMSYRGDGGEIIGFDIEIILRMARELDVRVVFDGMDFASVMPSVESGKALMGTGSIVATEERKEVVDFVNYAPASFILIVRAAAKPQTSAGFWGGLRESFRRTFLTESRYRMVLEGLGRTVVIALLSGALGFLLALGLTFARHRNNPVLNRLIGAYTSLIAGIPAVVILMVLYYIVFRKTSVSALIVAVVGFTLIFGARAFGVIWNTVLSVDEGQREAALALGYTEGHAFREVILPQAARGFYPLLLAQFVSLTKETSIAGYISVVELTRAGDLIRSRTMEAFFPLISIALLYYLLTCLLEAGARLLDLYLQKKQEERKIRGVDA